MISISYKTKQFLVFIVKLLVVMGAFYFMYNQIVQNKNLDWYKFETLVVQKTTLATVFFVLLFSIANRFLEILKWQNLVKVIYPISLYDATKQVLGALTAAIFTPNGLGEYAGKALYFSKKETKKVVFLNLVCNGIQMILTVVFGVFGLLLLGYGKEIGLFSFVVLLLFTLFFFIKKIKIKGYSLEKLVTKLSEIPNEIHIKNTVLATIRYLVFSHQYYVLFLIFGVDLPYFTMMATIAAVYFLASSLPSFQFLDFAVKGSVAVYFFGKLGINEWIIVFISTLMWFLNVVIPVIIGSYFVLKFKPSKL